MDNVSENFLEYKDNNLYDNPLKKVIGLFAGFVFIHLGGVGKMLVVRRGGEDAGCESLISPFSGIK